MIVDPGEDEPIGIRDGQGQGVSEEEVRIDSPGAEEGFTDPVVDCRVERESEVGGFQYRYDLMCTRRMKAYSG